MFKYIEFLLNLLEYVWYSFYFTEIEAFQPLQTDSHQFMTIIESLGNYIIINIIYLLIVLNKL